MKKHTLDMIFKIPWIRLQKNDIKQNGMPHNLTSSLVSRKLTSYNTHLIGHIYHKMTKPSRQPAQTRFEREYLAPGQRLRRENWQSTIPRGFAEATGCIFRVPSRGYVQQQIWVGATESSNLKVCHTSRELNEFVIKPTLPLQALKNATLCISSHQKLLPIPL